MSSAAPLPHRRDADGAGDGGQHGSSVGGVTHGGVGPDLADALAPRSAEPEADPTGIRALLASLPDPGPMPPTLVRRITESLAAEQARTAGVIDERSATEHPVTGHASERTRSGRSHPVSATSSRSQVTDIHSGATLTGTTSTSRPAPSRPRDEAVRFSKPAASHASRQRWQRPVLAVAGAAAAAAVVGTLGMNLVHGPSSSSTSAASSAANLNSAQQPTTPASAEGRAAGGAAGDRARSADSARAQLQLRSSATSYTSVNLADRSRRLLAIAPSATSPARSAGAVATSGGAKNCLQALGVPSKDRAVVDVASYQGQPAAVLVVTGAGGSTAYVVRRSCRTGHPGILAGPLALR